MDKALEQLQSLAEKAEDREVPLLSFVRRMADLGFTSGSAIRIVDDLIDSERVFLTNRYNLRLPA